MRASSVVMFSVLAAACTVSHADDDRDFSRTVAAEPRGAVEISNVTGSVIVTGWDRPEVDVKGELSGNVERVDVTSSNGRTTIKVVLPNMSMRSGEANLTVRVPKQSELSVTAVSADVTTTGMDGEQSLKSVSGDVRAELGSGDFEGKTVSGNIRLRGSAKTADVRVQSVSGDVSLERGAGQIEATSVSGNLRLELSPASSVRMRTTSGDLSFRGTLISPATLEAETISGDATLNARAEGGYEYEASSFSGDLSNCFGQSSVATSRHGPGTRLIGAQGGGKGRVRVKSMSGDVTLCDK